MDDYPFLQRGAAFQPRQLLPAAGSVFYRPLSREFYFALLSRAGNHPWVGHLVNAALLALVTILLTRFARRIGGTRFAWTTGFLFASLGSLPLLVGWISCIQDLAAMAFLLVALDLAWNGRHGAAAVLAVAALLSKETAIFFLPGLAFCALRPGRERRSLLILSPYAIALGLWVAVHPTLRQFLQHGPVSGSGGYVGLDNPFLGRNLLGMVGAALNVPLPGPLPAWPSRQTGVLLLALLGLLAWGRLGSATEDPRGSKAEILCVGALIGLVPAVLTVLSVKHWFPYYACMPAMGLSMLLAWLLMKWARPAALFAVSAFMIVGVWSRGLDRGKSTIPTEADFRRASECYRRIEAQFRRLRPTLPESARVYLAVLAPTDAGIHLTLTHFHALRTWYGNPTLVTRPAEYQEPTARPVSIFWITPGCDVYEITWPGLRVRSPGPRPSYSDYQKTVRSLALGQWADGDGEGGAALLLRMQEADRASWEFDHRLASALLLAEGRPDKAAALLNGLPAWPREEAVGAAAAALTPELPKPGLDEAVFRAFGLDAADPELHRALMFYFSDRALLKKTRRMAERLLVLHPGDEDAKAMIEALDKVPSWQQVFVPAEVDSVYRNAY